jgi:hypothetical protein
MTRFLFIFADVRRLPEFTDFDWEEEWPYVLNTFFPSLTFELECSAKGFPYPTSVFRT